MPILLAARGFWDIPYPAVFWFVVVACLGLFLYTCEQVRRIRIAAEATQKSQERTEGIIAAAFVAWKQRGR